MAKIYLPDSLTSSNCPYVYDKDTIRVYRETPRLNATIDYTDYFIHSDYISRTGSTTFGNYTNINITCLPITDFSTNAIYRTDITNIFICAFIFIFMCWFLVSRIVRRLFYGRKIF